MSNSQHGRMGGHSVGSFFFFPAVVIVVGTGHGAKRFVWRDGWMSYTDHRTRWVTGTGQWEAGGEGGCLGF